ncbi:MAG: FAD-dependent oxidoreductase [Pseudonocardiaceae bacterium]
MECEVLIVGAGPTGLTLACDLLASGVGVRVVDKASGPSTTSRALGLMPRGIEVLDRAGALGDLEQRANPIRRVVVDHGGPPGCPPAAGPDNETCHAPRSADLPGRDRGQPAPPSR